MSGKTVVAVDASDLKKVIEMLRIALSIDNGVVVEALLENAILILNKEVSK